jgi:hypothetical protein
MYEEGGVKDANEKVVGAMVSGSGGFESVDIAGGVGGHRPF